MNTPTEFTAIVQYMMQSEMCESWGYTRLANLTNARAIEEVKHAEFIEWIILPDAVPTVHVGLKLQLEANVQQQSRQDGVDSSD